MTNESQLSLLKQGVKVWNEWRHDHQRDHVDLMGANLNKAKLNGANLVRANLLEANLKSADLSGAELNGADLSSIGQSCWIGVGKNSRIAGKRSMNSAVVMLPF